MTNASDIKYALSTIVRQGANYNYGNSLIESSLRRILVLPEPTITFDSFQPMDKALIDRINTECDFVLSPGCTTLQVGQNAAYGSFDRISVPKICFGGALWQAGSKRMVTKVWEAMAAPAVLGRAGELHGHPDLAVARKHSAPVGARDPYTQQELAADGIPSWLIGCPTLLERVPTTKWRETKGKKAIVSFARFSLPTQARLVSRLRRRWQVSVLVHEPYEKQLLKLVPGVRLIEFNSPEQYLSEYRNADLVVTGRLHGALPAIRYGTPVIFYGMETDTRHSLLTFLRIPIHRLSVDVAEQAEALISALSSATFEKTLALRQEFQRYAEEFGIQTMLRE